MDSYRLNLIAAVASFLSIESNPYKIQIKTADFIFEAKCIIRIP